ncbi:restriction endonuclease subunit S [Citricoccus sp. SGAir0253]|uniref:restriction endonuclease subunit S n=1 Tax=Citricoccus sp. SGAir0253 TaxID=2567881 RepID=UPI00143DC2E1|nr:restriction endonuclease subunit S [Citricoccus sp. SGAir0253]
MKLKHVAHFVAGGTPDTNNEQFWSEQGIPWVSIGDMSAVDIVTSTAKSLTEAGVRNRRLTLGEPGTVLFAMYASVGAVATLGIAATWNQALLGIVPKPQRADPRFVAYWLKHYAPEAVAEARSATQANLNAEQVANFPFTEMDLAEQRRIADFIDDRVSRLDRIIAARRRQARLLQETLPNLIARELKARSAGTPQSIETGWEGHQLPEGWRASTLGRVLRQLTNGYVGPTRDILVDDGIRYIQSVHIKNGTIDFDRRPFYVSEEWHAARRRINLRAGDVLIVQTGAVGQVALVPEGFGEASCHALLIARANSSLISPEYLATFLQCNFGKQAMLARATGALHPHLEAGVRSTPLLLPPRSVQDQIVDRVREDQQVVRAGIRDLERSIALLAEYKSSLISAAVTGQLDVTTAGSTIPG